MSQGRGLPGRSLSKSSVLLCKLFSCLVSAQTLKPFLDLFLPLGSSVAVVRILLGIFQISLDGGQFLWQAL